MGTSWYDPAGPTPNFVSGQTNGTTYSARLGADALLDCRVTSLERDLVSWFRGAASRQSAFLLVSMRQLNERPTPTGNEGSVKALG